jgi:hypothetical protein
MLLLRGKQRTKYYDPKRFYGIFEVPSSNDVFKLAGWDIWDPTVFLIDGTYYMIYGRWPTGSIWYETGEIALATSSSFSGPFTHQSTILTSGSGWDNLAITNPKVIKDGNNWRMYYTGYNASIGNHPAICCATSTSLSGTWTKSTNNPILIKGSSGEWDDDSVDNPAPCLQDGIYHMAYKGGKLSPLWVGLGISSSSSWDGPFTKSGSPIVDTTYNQRWEDPHLWYEDNHFCLTAVCPPGNNVVSAHGTVWAWSDDGITFYQPPYGSKCYDASLFGKDTAERTTFLDLATPRKYMYVAKDPSDTSIAYAIFRD